MNTTEAIKILKQHNKWRRGEDDAIAMGNPGEIGEAIDAVIEAVSHGPRATSGGDHQFTIDTLQQDLDMCNDKIAQIRNAYDKMVIRNVEMVDVLQQQATELREGLYTALVAFESCCTGTMSISKSSDVMNTLWGILIKPENPTTGATK